MKRREFLGTSGITALAVGAATWPTQASENQKALKNKFVHHVYFWFKNPDKQEYHDRFRQALMELVTIESIQHYHVGTPAKTRREVIDSSYHYSLLTIFPDKAAHDIYQDHTVHDAFREVAGELCSKVVVFDSVDY